MRGSLTLSIGMTGRELRINEEVLQRAQQMDRGALESLIEAVCPALCRIAYGLAGRADVGRGIVRFVINHTLQQVEHWRDSADARRWFYHFTILVARRGRKHEPTAAADTLVENSGEVSAAYIAFVRGIRAIPFQQREAYLLPYGENLSPRDTATAMDCSTSAVAVHLQGAEQLLRPMAGEAYDSMKQRLARAYVNLAPRDDAIQPSVHRLI